MPDGDQPIQDLEPRVEHSARKTYLKKKDFEKHGFTEGCEGCKRMRAGGMDARPHSAQCRQRMEEQLKKEDNPRWRSAQARMNEKVWEEIKKNDPEAAAEDNSEARGGRGTAASSSGGGAGGSSSSGGGAGTNSAGKGGAETEG